MIPILTLFLLSLTQISLSQHSLESPDIVVHKLSPQEQLVFYWDPENTDGTSLAAGASAVEGNGLTIQAVTNGGIYYRQNGRRIPRGLYIENNQVLTPVNTESGWQNFFLQPNGVVAVIKNEIKILSTSEYMKQYPDNENVEFAIQSGPLLLEHRQIHRAFRPESDNQYTNRSAIGVTASGDVFIILARSATNLYGFASYLRDELRCTDALYLDGMISEFCTGELSDCNRGSFASVIAIVLKKSDDHE